ncbi:tetratricopeptide repeat protein [Salinarimonas soli]|uniref:Sel1 repeat family protein n=1 Tax=Salinarimonas soli TaxID=1638099 RepID=A0A5B2VB01_9HYPH|nr:SEL1-like repeat protein [Salinarimonas soli]KAA2235549.1 sel1 repeat family protein [Salinarimonas soli]
MTPRIRLIRLHVVALLAGMILAALQGAAAAGSLALGAAATCNRIAPLPSLDPREIPVTVVDLTVSKELSAAVEACRAAHRASFRPTGLTLQYARVLRASREPEAVPLLRDIAAEGDLEANYLLHRAYDAIDRDGAGPTVGGRLVTRAEAEAGLRRAAVGGHPEAIADLGRALAVGGAMRRDPVEARIWLERAMAPTARSSRRGDARIYYARLVAVDPLATQAERERAFDIVAEDGGSSRPSARILLGRYLRRGIGTQADPARARAIFEELLRHEHLEGEAGAELAEMLLAGEGGPQDARRAVTLMSKTSLPTVLSPEMQMLRARLLREGGVLGRDRAAAVCALSRVLYLPNDAIWPLAEMLAQVSTTLDRGQADAVRFRLEERADTGDLRAMLALARLKLGPHPGLRDEAGGYKLLEAAEAAGSDEAAALLAFRYGRWAADGTPVMAEHARAALERLLPANLPIAHTVHGKLLRLGWLYPQDDVAATQAIRRGAESGDMEAMTLLADAYRDGLGVPKDRAGELRWTRAAVTAGWLRGVDRLGFLFAFTRGDMTLREGITDVVALHLERINIQALPNFNGPLIDRHGLDTVARAVMDALRLVPAGLEDERFRPLVRDMPLRLRIAIERELIARGHLTGKAEGHLGPQARAALKAWADAEGPLGPEPMLAPAPVDAPPAPLAPGDDGGDPNKVTVSFEDGERVARHVAGLIQGAGTVADWRRAIGLVNLMARIGDPTARWFLVDRFDDDPHIRDAVSTAEITRYSLDMMLTRPDYAKKVEFKFLFNIIGVMTKRRDHDAFASAFLDWLRDDLRLQANLGRIFGQIDVAPRACLVLTREAVRRGVPEIGERNFCDDVARTALVAWARAAGPSGAELRLRREAREDILRLARELDTRGRPASR